MTDHLAIEAEVETFIESYKTQRLESGKQRIVRNGHLPEREIQTGIGPVEVKVPRVRDRKTNSDNKITFHPSWFPKYMRRTRSIESLLPLLYLKGMNWLH